MADTTFHITPTYFFEVARAGSAERQQSCALHSNMYNDIKYVFWLLLRCSNRVAHHKLVDHARPYGVREF